MTEQTQLEVIMRFLNSGAFIGVLIYAIGLERRLSRIEGKLSAAVTCAYARVTKGESNEQ